MKGTSEPELLIGPLGGRAHGLMTLWTIPRSLPSLEHTAKGLGQTEGSEKNCILNPVGSFLNSAFLRSVSGNARGAPTTPWIRQDSSSLGDTGWDAAAAQEPWVRRALRSLEGALPALRLRQGRMGAPGPKT